MDEEYNSEGLTSRRYFLAQGTRLVTAAGLSGALMTGLGFPNEAEALDWRSMFRGRQEGGGGKVQKLKGRATANGRFLKVGDRVNSGEQILVSSAAHLIISMVDNTIFRINGAAQFVMHASQRKTGIFRLLMGSILTVMPKNNRYLVQMPSASIGIKGTVFFHQIYAPGETTALDQDRNRVTIPEGIGEYFCLCNGQADFMKSVEKGVLYQDTSTYHNSYYLDPRQPKLLVGAPQLNHIDAEILELIALQEGRKHDSKFLENYTVDPAP